MINVTLSRAILLEIYLHCPDNVPVPIFVHLLHGYSQNCYLVGIEFPLNLNLEFLVQAGEWDIGLFQQIFPKIQLCQVVKHIGRGRPEHWATYIKQMVDLKEFRSKTAKFANLENSVGGRSDVVFLPIPGIYATRRLWVCSVQCSNNWPRFYSPIFFRVATPRLSCNLLFAFWSGHVL